MSNSPVSPSRSRSVGVRIGAARPRSRHQSTGGGDDGNQDVIDPEPGDLSRIPEQDGDGVVNNNTNAHLSSRRVLLSSASDDGEASVFTMNVEGSRSMRFSETLQVRVCTVLYHV